MKKKEPTALVHAFKHLYDRRTVFALFFIFFLGLASNTIKYADVNAEGDDPIDSIREPAELVNSRTTLYLWSYSKSTEHRSPKAVYSRELPPRY